MPARTRLPEAAPAGLALSPPHRTPLRPLPRPRKDSLTLSGEGTSMSRWLAALCVGLLWAGPSRAAGLLLPSDAATPPLALVRDEVEVTLVVQVAPPNVPQVFRKPADRALEATYGFRV